MDENEDTVEKQKGWSWTAYFAGFSQRKARDRVRFIYFKHLMCRYGNNRNSSSGNNGA